MQRDVYTVNYKAFSNKVRAKLQILPSSEEMVILVALVTAFVVVLVVVGRVVVISIRQVVLLLKTDCLIVTLFKTFHMEYWKFKMCNSFIFNILEDYNEVYCSNIYKSTIKKILTVTLIPYCKLEYILDPLRAKKTFVRK